MKPGDSLELTCTPTFVRGAAAGAGAEPKPGVAWLQDASAVNFGAGELPTPVPVRAEHAYRSEKDRERLDAEFVMIRGRVVGFDTFTSTYVVQGRAVTLKLDTLVLDDGGTRAYVMFHREVGARELFPIGIEGEFSGACRLEGAIPASGRGEIHILVPDTAHARVLQWPPFWEIPRYQRWIKIGLGALAAASGLAAMWLWFRHRRAKLTLAAEKASERARELERELEHARELHEMKSNFVSLVSHEFRTPLGVIMSATDVLRRYFDRLPAEKRERHLDMIFRSTRILADIIDEVLILGGLDEGRTQFVPAPVDLEKACRTFADETMSATGRACPIQFHGDGALTGAASDESLLRHIMCNLLSNAVKYSEPGTPVDFTATRSNGNAVLTVRDRGIGISKEDQARLFMSFTRGRNVGSRPGTGLGLVVVQRCVALHGGTLNVTSDVGKGTTVTVTLPVFSSN
jgi:signal transduction histidine kinase